LTASGNNPGQHCHPAARGPPPTDSGTRKPQQGMKVFDILLKGTPQNPECGLKFTYLRTYPHNGSTPQPKGREKSSSNEAAFS